MKNKLLNTVLVGLLAINLISCGEDAEKYEQCISQYISNHGQIVKEFKQPTGKSKTYFLTSIQLAKDGRNVKKTGKIPSWALVGTLVTHDINFKAGNKVLENLTQLDENCGKYYDELSSNNRKKYAMLQKARHNAVSVAQDSAIVLLNVLEKVPRSNLAGTKMEAFPSNDELKSTLNYK